MNKISLSLDHKYIQGWSNGKVVFKYPCGDEPLDKLVGRAANYLYSRFKDAGEVSSEIKKLLAEQLL